MLQIETLSDKTMCRGTKTIFQKFGNSRGEEGTKIPPGTEIPRRWEGHRKIPSMGGWGGGGYRHFLELHIAYLEPV